MWVNPLKEVGHYIDILNIMSYDAGPYVFRDTTKDASESQEYNPVESYNAYKSIFNGKVNIGLESPPEAWGGDLVSSEAVNNVANAVLANQGDGLFFWSIQKTSNGPLSTSAMAEQMCTALGNGNCKGGPGELPKK